MRGDFVRMCIRRDCWGIPKPGFRKCEACMKGQGPVKSPYGDEEE